MEFEKFLQQLSGHDQIRVQEILRDHPTLFSVLIKNIEVKKELSCTRSKVVARNIVDQIIAAESQTIRDLVENQDDT